MRPSVLQPVQSLYHQVDGDEMHLQFDYLLVDVGSTAARRYT
jgi:hypothetical protein